MSISSYAYSLMVIAYLQQVGIIGSLQQLACDETIVTVPDTCKRRRRGDRDSEQKMRHVNVSFATQTSSFPVSGIWHANGDGVTALFLGFMKYFGFTHRYVPFNHCDVKMGGIIPGRIALTKSKLVVMDPFERERNTAGNVEKALLYIIPEFRRVCQLIATDAAPAEIFENMVRSRKSVRGNFRRR